MVDERDIDAMDVALVELKAALVPGNGEQVTDEDLLQAVKRLCAVMELMHARIEGEAPH